MVRKVVIAAETAAARSSRHSPPVTSKKSSIRAKLNSENFNANTLIIKKYQNPDRHSTRTAQGQFCSVEKSTADGKKSPAKRIVKKKKLSPAKKSSDEGVRKIGEIYRQYKKSAGGADGGVVGLNGSIRATCLVRMLRALNIDGREILDFGAGDGRVLLAAIATGASKASGYELPENSAHRFVFNAVRTALSVSDSVALAPVAATSLPRADWIARDINNLQELPPDASCAYSFWVGMPLPTQEHILALCARSPSIDSIAVFRDRKWRKPEDGLSPIISLDVVI